MTPLGWPGLARQPVREGSLGGGGGTGRESSDARRASGLPGDLVEHTACTPQIHLGGVEAVGEEALRGAVPARGDVLGIRLLGVDAPAGPKVP